MGRLHKWYIGVVAGLAAGLFAAETPVPERDWTADLYGGFSLKRGNVEESSYRYSGDYEKKYGTLYSYRLSAYGRYMERYKTVRESKAQLLGEMRRMISERWFFSGEISAENDEIKNLTLRLKVGPGIGYYLVNSKTLKADIGTGFLYTHERPSEGDSDYLAWQVSQRVDWQMTESFKIWMGTRAFVSTKWAEDYEVALRAGAESKINGNLSLVVELENEYDNMPDEEEAIRRNDLELTTGLRYHF